MTREFHNGWPALTASAAGISVGPTLFLYVSSLFVLPFEEEFGWSRAEIAGAIVAIPLSAVFLPLVGVFIDRIGPRRAILFSTIGLAIGYLVLANIGGSIRSYYAGVFLAMLLGSAAGPIGYTRIISSWFRSRRGLALALALAGSSLGGIAYPFLVKWGISASDWRLSFYLLAALAVGVGVPAVLLGIRDGPYASAATPPERDNSDIRTYRQAFSLPEFWLLPITLALMAVPAAGIATQLQPLLVDRGVAPATAASLVSILGASILVGRLVTGLLLDRFWAPAIGAVILLLAAGGAAMVYFAGAGTGLAIAGVALIGMAQGAELDLAAYLTARYFGLPAYGRFFGLFFLVFTVALAFGGIAFGTLYDRFGSYDHAMLLSIACFVVAAGVITRLRRYEASSP